MAKLYFKYGTMKSGKSLDLIRTYDAYKRSGRSALVITPSIDTRAVGKVKTRLGIEISSHTIKPGELIKECPSFSSWTKQYDIILVDEVQFFSETDIKMLRELSEFIPVIAYGLKTDFRGKLFTGSKALIELAEDISEIKAVCQHCSKKATHNLRLDNGEAVYDGEVVQIGDSEYVPVCYTHYKNGGK